MRLNKIVQSKDARGHLATSTSTSPPRDRFVWSLQCCCREISNSTRRKLSVRIESLNRNPTVRRTDSSRTGPSTYTYLLMHDHIGKPKMHWFSWTIKWRDRFPFKTAWKSKRRSFDTFYKSLLIKHKMKNYLLFITLVVSMIDKIW